MLLLLGLADTGRDGFRTQEVVLAVAGKAKPDVLVDSKGFTLRRRNFSPDNRQTAITIKYVT